MHSAQAASSERQAALLLGASQWRDPDSRVRRRAREALRGGEWPPQVVEAALDAVLCDADAAIRGAQARGLGPTVLAILPGNILGPAIATAYCAAAAGAKLMLKSSSRELHLADIVAEQFEMLGPPIAGTLQAMRWVGGDVDFEAKVFPLVQRIVVFGDAATVEDVKRRVRASTAVIGYGTAYSIGFVPDDCEAGAAANKAARDIAIFDQRGCLSPQTIYVQGGEAKAILFAHALRGALDQLARSLPRARAEDDEKAAVAEFVRRSMVRALPSRTHALDTVLLGPNVDGVPAYVVVAEPYSSPVCAGFGRIVVVKPCLDVKQAAAAAKTLGRLLDSVGVAGQVSQLTHIAFADCGAVRVCSLGEMQRPPFGYRPKIDDFAEAASA